MTCYFEYKCRRCGKIDKGTITGSEKIAIAALTECLIDGCCSRFGIPVSMLCTHLCDDRGYGVSDLIGVNRVEDFPRTQEAGPSNTPATLTSDGLDRP